VISRGPVVVVVSAVVELGSDEADAPVVVVVAVSSPVVVPVVLAEEAEEAEEAEAVPVVAEPVPEVPEVPAAVLDPVDEVTASDSEAEPAVESPQAARRVATKNGVDRRSADMPAP
jgi:hypothetical protein